MSKRPADDAPIGPSFALALQASPLTRRRADLTGEDDKPAADGDVGGRRVRPRVRAPTTARRGRAGPGSDDDKGSDYAQSGSEEDDDDDDDDVEVSDYEEDDRDEVAEAKKGTAKAAPARARRARNPAAGACSQQRRHLPHCCVGFDTARCSGKKGGAEKKAAKAASGRPAPPPARRRRQFGEEELPDDYDDLEEELEDMPEGASRRATAGRDTTSQP